MSYPHGKNYLLNFFILQKLSFKFVKPLHSKAFNGV